MDMSCVINSHNMMDIITGMNPSDILNLDDRIL
jgi:hypothetical protein